MRFYIILMPNVLKLMRFSPKDRPKIRQFFEFMKSLNKQLIIFLSVFIIIIIIFDLTINIRSTAIEKSIFRSVQIQED